MAIAKCARCGKPYDKIRSPVCEMCQPDEDADYVRVRDVLSEAPGLNAAQAASAADVTVACVLRMLDDGQIDNPESLTPVSCGRCGAPAVSRTKRLCTRCIMALNQEFAETVSRLREEIRLERNMPPEPRSLKDAFPHRVRETVAQKLRTKTERGRKTADWRKDKYKS